MTEIIRIGSRASPLALAQTHQVRSALMAAHGLPESAFEIVPIVASGDKVQDRALAEIGGKALWTKELDQALGEGRIDCAVHSLKDVETVRPAAFALVAMLARADVRDRLIGADSIAALKQGATIGTSSPRRRAQLLRLRPDMNIVLFRGNVATRLEKLARGDVDATLLAAAGLARLGMHDVGTPIPLDVMLPAPSQGAIGVEARAGDARLAALLEPINHADTFACVMAERAWLAALGGDCHSAVAALAVCTAEGVQLRAEIYSPDGTEMVVGALAGQPQALAADMLSRASPQLQACFEGGAE